jgi:NAD(P)-dependent dehydrogenase (short-subunit alcohol dehydrogenase family)
VQLEGKRIIVTGGASGMGAATVRAYVREGARVVAMDVDDERGRAVAEATGAAYRHCDVARRDAVEAAFAEAVAELGGLDVLANPAGIERGGPPETLPDDEIAAVMGVNLSGTIHTNQAAFAPMRDGGGGRIVNFGSRAGVQGSPQAAHYAASKGAVLAWTRSVARAWAPYGIRVNAVAPGIWTPMYDLRRERLRTPEEIAAHDREKGALIPLGGKLGDADADFAPVMVFLASEASRFITGQTLPIDGGMMMLS